MFRWRPLDDARAVEVQLADGAPALVVRDGALPEQRHLLRDLTMIRRIRALELADDRWLFSFKPEGLVEVRGRRGAKLAERIGRSRPDVAVRVHHPDDDGSDGRSW